MYANPPWSQKSPRRRPSGRTHVRETTLTLTNTRIFRTRVAQIGFSGTDWAATLHLSGPAIGNHLPSDWTLLCDWIVLVQSDSGVKAGSGNFGVTLWALSFTHSLLALSLYSHVFKSTSFITLSFSNPTTDKKSVLQMYKLEIYFKCLQRLIYDKFWNYL